MLRLSIALFIAVAAACGGTTIVDSDAGPGDDASPGPDGSSSECFGPQVMCSVCDQSSLAECVDGGWICPVHSCPIDAGRDTSLPDAGIACGPTLVCDGATEYCRHVEGGPPPPPDASVIGSYSCDPIPAACEPSPTCACIEANGACTCTGSPDDFSVLCQVP
jgi:hypothetical protein